MKELIRDLAKTKSDNGPLKDLVNIYIAKIRIFEQVDCVHFDKQIEEAIINLN